MLTEVFFGAEKNKVKQSWAIVLIIRSFYCCFVLRCLAGTQHLHQNRSKRLQNMGGECDCNSRNFLPQSSRLHIKHHILGLAQMGALHIPTRVPLVFQLVSLISTASFSHLHGQTCASKILPSFWF